MRPSRSFERNTLHFFTCGNLISADNWNKLGNHISSKEDKYLNHIHLENKSNYQIFKEILTRQSTFVKNDIVFVLWNNLRIVDGVIFKNNTPSVIAGDKITSIDFEDYFSFVKDKQKFYHEESILLFGLISSFLHSLKDNGIFIVEMFTHKTRFIDWTHPISFEDNVSLHDYLYDNNIIHSASDSLDYLKFEKIGDVILSHIQGQK